MTLRLPKANIPQTHAERWRLLQWVRGMGLKVVPPVPLQQLQSFADQVIQNHECNPVYRDYIAILISNELWKEQFAAVPFERRLLLLPKCLRKTGQCKAEFDEFGLLCKGCGQCSIEELQAEAERLGYSVLVAEGSAVVMALIQSRKIEAIVGVSCLNVLEKAFPNMEAAAIPGMAIPLLQDDCHDTSLDIEWLHEVLHLAQDHAASRLNLDDLRAMVDSWFAPAALAQFMGEEGGVTGAIAREWLGRAGKRWRPLLCAAVFQALRTDLDQPIPSDVQRIAVAVECFHKASLIHDDIEDGDMERYGARTLPGDYGIPVALNVGDLLIGEGYRLIASAQSTPNQIVQMIRCASEGQRQLCFGQGMELAWVAESAASPGKSLEREEVLALFRQKTSPAFEVALQLGALCAGEHFQQELAPILKSYSQAIGIAYQIRDDLEDSLADSAAARPSLLPLVSREEAVMLLEDYKEEAIRALSTLENATLKGLLRRLVGKIFRETDFNSWCREIRQAKSS